MSLQVTLLLSSTRLVRPSFYVTCLRLELWFIVENVCNKNNMIYGYDRPGGDMPDSVFHFDTALECCWKCVTTLGTTC